MRVASYDWAPYMISLLQELQNEKRNLTGIVVPCGDPC